MPPAGCIFVQQLRKTQETVNSFTKTIAFCTFKNPSFFSLLFLKVRNVPFSFCNETSKQAKEKLLKAPQ